MDWSLTTVALALIAVAAVSKEAVGIADHARDGLRLAR